MIVKYGKSVRNITLVTGVEPEVSKQEEIETKMKLVRENLMEHNVVLTTVTRESLHDRCIKLNNGWIIKLGRGLDIWQKVPKFSIGAYDYELRPTFGTTKNFRILLNSFFKNRNEH